MGWAVTCLLLNYADGLTRLREAWAEPPATRWGRLFRRRRIVATANDLDQYLLGEGLDVQAICPGLRRYAAAQSSRGREDDYVPVDVTPPIGGQPGLEEAIWQGIRREAKSVLNDRTSAIEDIRASAELRQAVANTKLQRRVVFLAFVTLAVAVVSLVVAWLGYEQSKTQGAGEPRTGWGWSDVLVAPRSDPKLAAGLPALRR